MNAFPGGRRRYPTTLMYHGVGPDEAAARSQSWLIGAHALAAQMDFIARIGTFLHPSEVRARLERRLGFAWNEFLVTSDDGFQNVVEHGVPVWKQRGIVPLVFVSTAHIDSDDWLWFARLECGRRRGMKEQAADILQMLDHDRCTVDAVEEALSAAYFPNRQDATSDERLMFDGFRGDAWRDAVRTGDIVVGSHTVRHPRLSYESSERVQEELSRSRSILEQWLDEEIWGFAYPQGDRSDEVTEQVARAGYEVAFMAGADRAGDMPYGVPRVGVYRRSAWLMLLKVLRSGFLGREYSSAQSS